MTSTATAPLPRGRDRRAATAALRPAISTTATVAAVVVALGCAWGLLLPPGGRSAAAAEEELPAPVVAVIDYQRVMSEAAAARGIRDQLETRRQQFQEEIAAEEQRLHEADKELARQRSLLTPEAFAERRRRQLDRASAEAHDAIKAALVDVVRAMAEERGFNLVLPAAEVLFFGRRLDLTEEVMARLDEALPAVELPQVAADEESQ